MSKQVSTPVAIAVVLAVVVVAGIFLFRGVTGGQQGDGKTGNIEAAPPAPKKGIVPGAPPSMTGR
ncbi:MAG TPA: hypothetical protein VFB21_20800 [Chthonomonadaceae bacterium]|nr:hypothetical protein [Chthonomonadaceae bacterium]